MSGHRSRRGLTLVEVLAILFVLILLAGFLLPIFSRARNASRRPRCGGVLSQIGKACVMYSTVVGNRGRFPDDGASALNSLNMLYDGFIKDPDVFRCPSARNYGPPNPNKFPGSVPNLDRTMSPYGYDRGHRAEHGLPCLAGDLAGSPCTGAMDASDNSTNHGEKDGMGLGQNVLSAAGAVEWFEQPFKDVNGQLDQFFVPGPDTHGDDDTVLKDD